MLLPVLARPNAPSSSARTRAATYGDLLSASKQAANDADQTASTRGLDVTAVRVELDGYERFLVTATRHIHALLDIAGIPVGQHWENDVRLPRQERHLGGAGHWHRAADTLGAAHDLVASHFDGVLVPVTAEAKRLVLGPAAAGSCADVAAFVLDAVASSDSLIHRASLAQKHVSPKPIPPQVFTRIRRSNRSAGLSGRSTLWELRHAINGDGPRLDDLLTAYSPTIEFGTTSFESSLAALRVLREISHRQALAQTAASPASLRDLTLVSSRILAQAAERTASQPAETALARLRRAHALDLIQHAQDAWTSAGAGLTTKVRGVTRAPAAYQAAANDLLTSELARSEHSALVVALPALARDAARTVERLAAARDLVTVQRDPLATRGAWRPITSGQGRELVGRFLAAERTSLRAASAVLTATPSGPTRPADVLQRDLAAGRELRLGRSHV